MEYQGQLFPADEIGARSPSAEFAATASLLTAEIAAFWGLPLGGRVQVKLRDHDLSSTTGLLELMALPDLPFNPRQALSLRIGLDYFTSRQIIAWVLVS